MTKTKILTWILMWCMLSISVLASLSGDNFETAVTGYNVNYWDSSNGLTVDIATIFEGLQSIKFSGAGAKDITKTSNNLLGAEYQVYGYIPDLPVSPEAINFFVKTGGSYKGIQVGAANYVVQDSSAVMIGATAVIEDSWVGFKIKTYGNGSIIYYLNTSSVTGWVAIASSTGNTGSVEEVKITGSPSAYVSYWDDFNMSTDATCVLMSDYSTPVVWPACATPSAASIWTIGADTYCHDGEIISCNNITILTNKILKINNVVLIVNYTLAPNYTAFISMNTGSKLYINNSIINVSADFLALGGTYTIRSGSAAETIEFINTNFSYAGNSNDDAIVVRTNNLILLNNTFHHMGNDGVTSKNTPHNNCTIVNNVFYDNNISSYVVNLKCNATNFSNNYLIGKTSVLLLGANNSVFKDNIFKSNNRTEFCLQANTNNIDNLTLEGNIFSDCNSTKLSLISNLSIINNRFINVSINSITTNITLVSNNFANGNNLTHHTGYLDDLFHFQAATMIKFYNNTLLNYGVGIFTYRSYNVTMDSNYCENITIHDGACFNIDQTNNSYLINNVCINTNRSCIMAAECVNVSLVNNYAYCIPERPSRLCTSGLHDGSRNSYIINNTINGYIYGLSSGFGDYTIPAWNTAGPGTNKTIYNNRFYNSNYGFELKNGYNNNVSYNVIINYSRYGIYIENITNSIMEYNTIYSNGTGTSLLMFYNNCTLMSKNNILNNIGTYTYRQTYNSTVNSSNDVFDVNKVSVDATSSLDKWVDVGIRVDNHRLDSYIYLYNGSQMWPLLLSDGETAVTSVMQYDNVGGTARNYSYNMYYYHHSGNYTTFNNNVDGSVIPSYWFWRLDIPDTCVNNLVSGRQAITIIFGFWVVIAGILLAGLLLKMNGNDSIPIIITELNFWVTFAVIAVLTSAIGVIGVMILEKLC
jgi:hypothetical protein